MGYLQQKLHRYLTPELFAQLFTFCLGGILTYFILNKVFRRIRSNNPTPNNTHTNDHHSHDQIKTTPQSLPLSTPFTSSTTPTLMVHTLQPLALPPSSSNAHSNASPSKFPQITTQSLSTTPKPRPSQLQHINTLSILHHKAIISAMMHPQKLKSLNSPVSHRNYIIVRFHHPLSHRSANVDITAFHNTNVEESYPPYERIQHTHLPQLQFSEIYKASVMQHQQKVVAAQKQVLQHTIATHPKIAKLPILISANNILFTDASLTKISHHGVQYIMYLINNHCDIYLSIHCVSQQHETAAYTALKEAKLLGLKKIPLHHVLFCAKWSTVSSFARQILPILFITSDVKHITPQLKSHIPHIAIISAPSEGESKNQLIQSLQTQWIAQFPKSSNSNVVVPGSQLPFFATSVIELAQ